MTTKIQSASAPPTTTSSRFPRFFGSSRSRRPSASASPSPTHSPNTLQSNQHHHNTPLHSTQTHHENDSSEWYTPYNGPIETRPPNQLASSGADSHLAGNRSEDELSTFPYTYPHSRSSQGATAAYSPALPLTSATLGRTSNPHLSGASGSGRASGSGSGHGNGNGNGNGYGNGGIRTRAYSEVSTQGTMSSASGTVDPFRRSGAIPPPVPVHAYAGTGIGFSPSPSGGGVGESPIPVQRFSTHHGLPYNPQPAGTTSGTGGNRISLAGLFGAGGRQRAQSSSYQPAADAYGNTSPSKGRPTSPASRLLQRRATGGRQGLRTRASTAGESGGGGVPSYTGNAILSGTTARNTDTITSANVEEDYIASYYSTLIPSPEIDAPQFVNVQTGQPMSASASPRSIMSRLGGSESPLFDQPSFSQTSSPHPYAYAFSPSPSPNQVQEGEFEYDVEREAREEREREERRQRERGTGTGTGRRNLEPPRIPTSTIYSVSPIPLSPFVNAGFVNREKDREKGKAPGQSEPLLFESPRAPPEIPQSPTPTGHNHTNSPKANFSYPMTHSNLNNQYSQHYIPSSQNHNYPYSQSQQRYDPTQSSHHSTHPNPQQPNFKPSVRYSLLKAISTPNLRGFTKQPQPIQPSSAMATTAVMPPPIITTQPGPTGGGSGSGSGNAQGQGQAQKRRQRWLSPETWCDALLFPRPRFAVRVDEDGNGHSGLVISPPDSPIVSWKPEYSGAGERTGLTTAREAPLAMSGRLGSSLGRRIPKSKSALNLSTPSLSASGPLVMANVNPRSAQERERGTGQPIAGPSRLPSEYLDVAGLGPAVDGGSGSGIGERQRHRDTGNVERMQGMGEPVVVPRADPNTNVTTPATTATLGANATTNTNSTLRPPRPRSFAQDDLSLPSPVPSLTQVLKDGDELEKERKAWQAQASRSFQNKRTRTLSRSRSRSTSNVRTPQHHSRNTQKSVHIQAFDFLAERSLLGSQRVPPTIHVRLSPVEGSAGMQPFSRLGTFSSSSGTHSRSQSKNNASSLGRSQSAKSTTSGGHGTGTGLGHSTSTQGHSRGHSRNESWGKTALKTAAGMCFSAEDFSPLENHADFKAGAGVGADAILAGELLRSDGTLRRDGGTKVVHLEEQMREERLSENAEREGRGHARVASVPGEVIAIPPNMNGSSGGKGSASAALALMSTAGAGQTLEMPVPSPVPSGMTISGEGVPMGIALSSPPESSEEEIGAVGAFGRGQDVREVITFPGHPYAQAGIFPSPSQAAANSYDDDPYSRPTGATTSKHRHTRTKSKGSDYAGPHPSEYAPPDELDRQRKISLDAASNGSVSARHRLPPHVILHPYAQAASGAYTSDPRESMYAQVPSSGRVRQVSLDEIRASPLLPGQFILPPPPPPAAAVAGPSASRPLSHAYAKGLNRVSHGEPLDIGDTLVRVLRRRGSADSGLGDSVEQTQANMAVNPLEVPAPVILAPRREDREEEEEEEDRREMDASSSAYLHPYAAAMFGTPDRRERLQRNKASMNSGQTGQTYASSPPETLNPSIFRGFAGSPSNEYALRQQLHGSNGSSPGVSTGSSSPPLSPKPFSSVEDLERFRGLFYTPADEISELGHERSAEDAGAGEAEEEEEEETVTMPAPIQHGAGPSANLPPRNVPASVSSMSRSSQAGSGMLNMTRGLSEEFVALQMETRPSMESSMSGSNLWGRRYGSRGSRPKDDQSQVLPSTDALGVAMERSDSPEAMNAATLPLRMHRTQDSRGAPKPPTINIPEDVGSSRASSLLERTDADSPEEDNLDRLHPMRVGTVDAELSTPPAQYADHRFSGHVSFVTDGQAAPGNNEGERHGQNLQPSPIESSQKHQSFSQPPSSGSRVISSSSLAPPNTGVSSGARSSYMTTGSHDSRMSGLSDFPSPPEQVVVSPAHVSLLHSYFGTGFTPATQTQTVQDPLAAAGEAMAAVEAPHLRPRVLEQRPSFRTTFGGQPDHEITIAQGPSSSPSSTQPSPSDA